MINISGGQISPALQLLRLPDENCFKIHLFSFSGRILMLSYYGLSCYEYIMHKELNNWNYAKIARWPK